LGPDQWDDTAWGVAAVAPEPAAVCRDVHKVYVVADEEVEALREVDKEFPPGRVTTVVGPSGSGKSSLLRILACVDRPTAGSVRVGGQEVADLGVRRRRALRRTAVGYVFQNPSCSRPGSPAGCGSCGRGPRS